MPIVDPGNQTDSTMFQAHWTTINNLQDQLSRQWEFGFRDFQETTKQVMSKEDHRLLEIMNSTCKTQDDK